MLFIKAVVIGCSIAAPVGPIGLLCIQRSLKRGFRSGFATGMGAASADAIYGLLGAIGVAGVALSSPSLAMILKIMGGAFLVWLAWGIARDMRKPLSESKEEVSAAAARDFLTAFGLTLSNPMTILSFIAIFAALDPLSGGHDQTGNAMWLATLTMVAGVFLGSAAWWLCLSGTTSVLRQKMSASFMHTVSSVSALAIGAFGLVQVVSGVRAVL